LPVRIKKGMARRVKLVVLEYILAGIMHKTSVSPKATKKITAVKPMEIAMGSPIMIKNNNTPKMAAVIMVFSFCHKKLQLTLPLDACLPVGRGASPVEYCNILHRGKVGVTHYFFLASSTYFINVFTLSSPAYFPILS
jgi:hypothetical protein